MQADGAMNQRSRIGICAAYACAIEVTAEKPGNVHPGQSFPKLAFRDFVRSARAIAPVMDVAPGQAVGLTILQAIQATRLVVSTNTNLGIVLLLTPLATVPSVVELRPGLSRVLSNLTVDDARHAYQAIRLAEPGGLGEVGEQDVANEPTVTLREAMALAAHRDLIAAQYVNNFADVFAATDWLARQVSGGVYPRRLGTPAGINPAAHDRLATGLYFHLLAHHPDSLVRRKRGDLEAAELQRRAAAIVAAPRAQRPARLAELDAWFAAAFPHRNPGTTADMVAACLFVALREGIIPLPEVPAFFTAPS
jgi:triphosphoribosyl-dephospho-CoA synthase